MKVLFCDTWTYGWPYIEPVAHEIAARGHEVVFLHFHSLETGRADGLEVADNIATVYDVCDFKYSVDAAIRTLSPDMVITISVHGFLQRWLVSVAKRHGIPICGYMHGFRSGQFYRVTRKRKLGEKLGGTKKYVRQCRFFLREKVVRIKCDGIIPLALAIGVLTDMAFRRKKSKDKPYIDFGLDYDLMAVNLHDDIEYYQSNYFKFGRSPKFLVTGNLPLAAQLKTFDWTRRAAQVKRPLFISQPLYATGAISLKSYCLLVTSLAREVRRRSGVNLVVRPHPRDTDALIRNITGEEGVEVNSDLSLVRQMERASVVMGVNSTVLIGAAQLGLYVAMIKMENIPVINALETWQNVSIVSGDSKVGIEEVLSLAEHGDPSTGDADKHLSRASEIDRFVDEVEAMGERRSPSEQ